MKKSVTKVNRWMAATAIAIVCCAVSVVGTSPAQAAAKKPVPKSKPGAHGKNSKPIDTTGPQKSEPKDFSYLVPTLEDRMGRYWHGVSTGPTKYCQIKFDLMCDGRSTNFVTWHSSGDKNYDSVCKSCIDQAGPYAPFEGIDRIEVVVHFHTEPKGGDLGVSLPGYQSANSLADKQIAAKRVYNNNVIKIMKDRIVKAQQVLGSDSPKLSESINFMANAQKDNNDYIGAEASFRWAMAIRSKANGPDSRELAQSISDMGEMFRQKGDMASAEDCFKQVVNRSGLKPCPELVTAIQRYARICLATNRQADADILYKRLADVQAGKTLQPLPASLLLDPNAPSVVNIPHADEKEATQSKSTSTPTVAPAETAPEVKPATKP